MILAGMTALAGWIVLSGLGRWSDPASLSSGPGGNDQARLVSIEPLPMDSAGSPQGAEGEYCEWVPASASQTLAASLQQSAAAARQATRGDLSQRTPLRIIRDPNATISSVAVDPRRNELVATDENLFQILVYDRTANTPPTATMTEPKRIIGGRQTKIEFQCALYIDPESGDIYAVNNDTVDTLVIFSRESRGNVPPTRELYTPHGTFGIAVDERNQEMFLSVQHSNAVVVYPKTAQKDDPPIRLLQGVRTRLTDPHGIAIDTKNNLLFVANHGNHREFSPGVGAFWGRTSANPNWPLRRTIPGSGQTFPSTITVYALNARGDTPPLRVIEGPRTQLNWPAGMAVDPDRGELFVANDAGDSVLVFPVNAQGDAAPIRVLKGPRSGVKNPTSVFVDKQNDELWVANFGNHTATVYKPTAGGDTPPLRTIRSAPADQPALMIGNPGSVAYDSKREEILVPN
jgi:DNA-binding beta-propeller fold protein YncE